MTEAGERDYYSSNRPRHPLNVLMARVCFKPIMLYIEMHLVRTYFLCSVMTFSYYVMFIHNMFIFKKKAYRGFSLLYNCQHGRCLLVEDKRWSWQIRGRYLDVLHTMKSVISFPLEDKHVVNKHHVIRKSHDATHKKNALMSGAHWARGAFQCTTWLIWNKLTASKTLLWRRQKIMGVVVYWEE